MRRLDCMAAFYAIEGGQYVYYESEEGRLVRRFSANRLAIAYDSEDLSLIEIGDVDGVLRRAQERRKELRSQGNPQKASKYHVSMLPPQHRVEEVNRVLAEAEYFTTFLQKAGLL